MFSTNQMESIEMKKEDLKNVNLKVLDLFEVVSSAENFKLHPQVIFESAFVSVGNDIEKKKQTQKFSKRMNVMMKDMDDLHALRSKVVSVLRDFYCHFVIVSSDYGYSSIAKHYATLARAVKDYTKFMKSQKKNPEIIELGEEFKFLEELNVFDLMREDLMSFQPVVQGRIDAHKEKYPDFVPRSEVTAEINWDAVKEAYKAG